MPWKFINSTDVESLSKRQAVMERIDRWGAAFAAHAPQVEASLRSEPGPDLAAWMRENLGAVNPRLTWEFGADPAATNGTAASVDASAELPASGRYLVVGTGPELHLRPMAESLMRRAPELSGWKFHQYRPPEPPEQAVEGAKARTGQSVAGATVHAATGSFNRVDLLFQTRLASADEDAAREAAVAVAGRLLGEELYAKWVGTVDVTGVSRTLGAEKFVLLPRLRPVVVSLISSVLAQLPEQPYARVSSSTLKWSGYKLDPREADDYGGQDDLAVGTSAVPEVRKAVAADAPFYSGRFSRHAEVFCYLKVDAGDVSFDGRFGRKQKIEEVLDPALRKADVGRVVGTGTGLRYLYFDLAVADLPRLVATLRTALLPNDLLPERAWVLFFDAELSHEYLPLRSGTPAPPLFPPAGRPPKPARVAPVAPPPAQRDVVSPLSALDPLEPL